MQDLRIGLEVHVQILSLKTKLFCSCSSDYRGKPPNTNVCPICMGLPGTLPVLNKGAVKEAAKVALALHCKINRISRFYRKNYFYPDLAKNFQISQYDRAGGVPFAQDGYLEMSDGKRVRIRRIHLEEDPARIVYEGGITRSPHALVDYNRHGIALLEIVTEPDISDPAKAREFLEKLASILEYLGVYKPGVEGAIRCDANISLPGGARVEVKNISGFVDVEKALRFEATRQESRISRGINVERETRHWDEIRKITVSLRTKEEEEEYRYFPEPDLPPIVVTDDILEEAKVAIPELPEDKRSRYMKEYGISGTLAEALAYSPSLAGLFEEVVASGAPPKSVASIIAIDLVSYINERGIEVEDLRSNPRRIAGLAKLMEKGELSHKDVKRCLYHMLDHDVGTGEAMKALGLTGGFLLNEELERIVDQVMAENPKAVEDARRNPKALNYIVGLVLKRASGRVDARAAARLIAGKIRST